MVFSDMEVKPSFQEINGDTKEHTHKEAGDI
jgi:hypothetical protein